MNTAAAEILSHKEVQVKVSGDTVKKILTVLVTVKVMSSITVSYADVLVAKDNHKKVDESGKLLM